MWQIYFTSSFISFYIWVLIAIGKPADGNITTTHWTVVVEYTA